MSAAVILLFPISAGLINKLSNSGLLKQWNSKSAGGLICCGLLLWKNVTRTFDRSNLWIVKEKHGFWFCLGKLKIS